MSVNVELLKSVMSHIEAHPELFDAVSWRGKSTRDFAGWAAELSGATWLFAHDDHESIKVGGQRMYRGSVVRTSTGVVLHVEDCAVSVLGIDEQIAEALFVGSNTLVDLREMVDNLCDFGTVYDAAPKTQAEVTAP